ncbi:hypothetical protein [Sphingomonas sanxanigenens]|uniref:Uncharacterized protein n=1 Tax=Sphingomonas sanxanigenens DSM 19645 = NX02 TaxID=1123269 RepID=W0A6C0_9SPHN|nr:hypothetical protein [Sphingomonas sanxanigenens]AHE51893.1 hypothetical protein NX02_00630 [Sphingomonas sanxanigenens DSM 19645 = NX02]
MRYKVKAETFAAFEAAKKVAVADAKVFVISDSRRTLSTGELSEVTKQRLRLLGAKVLPEQQYDGGSI